MKFMSKKKKMKKGVIIGIVGMVIFGFLFLLSAIIQIGNEGGFLGLLPISILGFVISLIVTLIFWYKME